MRNFPQSYPQVFTVDDWRHLYVHNAVPLSVPGWLERPYTVPIPVVNLPPAYPQYDKTLAYLRNA